MAKNSKTDDKALFRDTVGEVRPVSTKRLHLAGPRPRARARFTRLDEASVLAESLLGGPEHLDVETGEELSYRRSGVAPPVLRKLRQGGYAIQAEMDLHGMTSNEARTALREFMAECLALDLRCVRIVHGKGLRSGDRGPVLKTSVNRWLRQWNEVLAFCSAPRRDGGTGAIYVLIRG
jgi:DNA-nicking Smr family endonuclease